MTTNMSIARLLKRAGPGGCNVELERNLGMAEVTLASTGHVREVRLGIWIELVTVVWMN